MDEMLKFVTLDGGLKKKTQKIFCGFCKMTQFKELSWLSFGLNDLF